jgi:hypothetical protein
MQQWQLGLPLHLAEYDYVIDTFQRVQKGYVIHFHSGTDVPEGTSYLVDIQGGSAPGNHTSGSEIRLANEVAYSENFIYSGSPPSGELTVELTLVDTAAVSGPWALTWSPPGTTP